MSIGVKRVGKRGERRIKGERAVGMLAFISPSSKDPSKEREAQGEEYEWGLGKSRPSKPRRQEKGKGST